MGFMTIWLKWIVSWVWKSMLYFIGENVQFFQTLTFFPSQRNGSFNISKFAPQALTAAELNFK